MKNASSQRGFTIIEISIFLAISGLLLLIAFAGTSRAVASARFTDAIRALESELQAQYDNVLNGINDRTVNAEALCGSRPVSKEVGTSPNCYLLGKFVWFSSDSGQIQEKYIVGFEKPGLTDEQLSQLKIQDYTPTVIADTNSSEYTIPWGAQVTGMIRTGSAGRQAANSLALIRSPVTGAISAYLFQSNGNPSISAMQTVVSGASSNPQGTICLQSADVAADTAGIRIGASSASTQTSIRADFDIRTSDCGGAI